MKKIVVSKQAVRDLIRELLSNPGVGWESHGDLSTAPVGVSAVVDPSAAETDPSNPNFKPRNRMELKPAVSTLIDDISDDKAPDFYDALRGALDDMKDEDEEMKKKDSKVEEAVRLAIRKMIAEAGPYRDTGMSYSGPMIGSASSGMEECEACEGSGTTSTGAPCEECGGEGEVKARKKRGYEMADTEEGMGTFDQIAKEMGYAGPPGARQAVQKALEKAKFVATMDPDELQIITLTAMNDYVDMLNKSGELTPADVQLMKDHPGITSTLDGFREYLDKVLKKAQKSGQKVVDPVRD